MAMQTTTRTTKTSKGAVHQGFGSWSDGEPVESTSPTQGTPSKKTKTADPEKGNSGKAETPPQTPPENNGPSKGKSAQVSGPINVSAPGPGGWYTLTDGDGNTLDKVQGADKADARRAELMKEHGIEE